VRTQVGELALTQFSPQEIVLCAAVAALIIGCIVYAILKDRRNGK
jgi:hypothetical protein